MNEQYQAPEQNKPAAAKWLWITLIVVVLIGGAFAAWYFLAGPGKAVESSTATTTTTPVDETADWLTYTDSVNGFSFKYPKTWFTDISATDQTVLVSNYQKASKYDKSTAPADLLTVGAMEYKTAVQTADQKNLISTVTVGDVTVSSLRSSESTSDSKIVARKVGQFTANNKTFVLWVGTGDELASRVQNEITYFDKIVKTIKITTAAASATTSTADWKTYTNATYGFGLTFTDSWKDYTIKQGSQDILGTGDTAVLASYEISVPTTNNKSVMSIIVYTSEAYAKSVAAADPGPGAVMGKTAKYVITYVAANGLHGEPDSTFAKTYIPALVKTFKVL